MYKLLAWAKFCNAGAVIAAFVGEGAVPGAYNDYHGRLPAFQKCSSLEEARKWVEEQARALTVSVKWIDRAPDGYQTLFE